MLERETCAVAAPAAPSQAIKDVILPTPVISIKLTLYFRRKGSYEARLYKALVREQVTAGGLRLGDLTVSLPL